MSDTEKALRNLRDVIAGIITSLETWDSLNEVCIKLDLPKLDGNGLSKANFLRKVTGEASDEKIINVAKVFLAAYPGVRGRPSESDLQIVQDALWWIESDGIQTITNVTRYKIAESLEGMKFWGRLSIRDFFISTVPLTKSEFLPDGGDDGYLYQGLSYLPFANLFLGPKVEKSRPTRIRVINWLREIDFLEWPDKRFCLFIERVVHPEVQPPNVQKQFVDILNKHLKNDGFILREEDSQGGVPIYRVRNFRASSAVKIPKYIIFASNGPKPDIVIDDALNMDIRIVKNKEKCLIYDQPPPRGDLTWQMLVDWWAKINKEDANDPNCRRELGLRLRESLQSEPERLLFDTYFTHFKPKYESNLPALIPQVYLHYDPRNRSERQNPVLVRQRMDFLLLLRNNVRVVLEVDGVHHYADENSSASPQRYAEMVSEDRRIKLLGYDVFRFGGAEFVNQNNAEKTIVSFFDRLFCQYGIKP